MMGLIGTKIGMSQVFDDTGNVIPVTVVETGPCVVVQKKDVARDGYNALQLGFGRQKNQRVNRPLRGHMAKAEKGSFRFLREFRVDDVSDYEVGQELTVTDLAEPGDLVDVTGTSKGRGFSGVMKRWDFRGVSRTHGTHEYFRHGGSIGACAYPGKVFKGKRMAGHWGNERVSVQNLRVVGVRPEQNLLLVKGAVPGANGGMVLIRRAVKG